jgi:hypothetical protein
VFNVLAWQALFVGGIVIGALWGKGDIDFGRVFRPEATALAKIALLFVLFFMAWRLGLTWHLIPRPVVERFRILENRPEFSLVFLLNFLASGYALAWTLSVGREAAAAPVRRIAGALRVLFAFPFLRLLGRHSLQVYAWHVVLVYLLKLVDGYFGPFGEVTKTAIAVTAILLLALPALLRERWKPPRPAAAAEAGAAGPTAAGRPQATG